jgi:hypothetical protein
MGESPYYRPVPGSLELAGVCRCNDSHLRQDVESRWRSIPAFSPRATASAIARQLSENLAQAVKMERRTQVIVTGLPYSPQNSVG